jgi:hypothetical protein
MLEPERRPMATVNASHGAVARTARCVSGERAGSNFRGSAQAPRLGVARVRPSMVNMAFQKDELTEQLVPPAP